jgi:hypothetical protein
MRNTLILDDDVPAKRKTESQRADRPFGQIVNETLPGGREAGEPPPCTGPSR